MVKVINTMMTSIKTTMVKMATLFKTFAMICLQVPLAMPQRVKREAHDVILDFIRSRPPLKPVRKSLLFF